MTPFTILSNEARKHRTVIITAKEADGSLEQREVEAYSVRQKPGGALLHYWCLKKNQHRSTYLHNLLSARPTGQQFTPRWTVEL